MQLESLLPHPHPPKPLLPPQKVKRSKIQIMQEHPLSPLQSHPVLQFVAAKSLILSLQNFFYNVILCRIAWVLSSRMQIF